MLLRLVAVALAMVSALPVIAQTLSVEGVLSPAWLERGGAREPLAPGVALAGGDRVVTGPGARVLLRMSEGSAVKLGENALLGVDALVEKKGSERLVTAALDVARGAFRFTTGLFGRPRAQRDVSIRVNSATAGIRGTDVWGKSEADRDIVCLIDGRITVEHAGRAFTMQEPLSFFIAPRVGAPGPVAPVPRQQVDEWSRETEIRDGSGAVRRGGGSGVEVVDTADAAAATNAHAKLREAGFPARIVSTEDAYGAGRHVVRFDGLAGSADARALVARLKVLGFGDARVR